MTTTWATYTASGVSSEGTLVVRPKMPPAAAMRGIIWCHGAGATALEPRAYATSPGLYRILDALAVAGYPVLSCDLGGSQWGSDTAISRITAAKTYLQGTLGAASGKVGFVGSSMGHANACAWAAQNLSSTAFIVGLEPVSDLAELYANASYTASINTAYGGTYSDTTNGPTHNPKKIALAGSLAGLPWLGYYGTADTTVTPTSVAAFVAALGSSAEARPLTGAVHDYAAFASVPPAEVLAFVQAHA